MKSVTIQLGDETEMRPMVDEDADTLSLGFSCNHVATETPVGDDDCLTVEGRVISHNL